MVAAEAEGAILVGLDVRRASRAGGPAASAEESLDELAVLAESAGARVLARSVQVREAPEAATLVGSGKLRELAEQVRAFDAQLVVFDRDLTPTQLRNLERALDCKVLDRTQLILDIFASRARTREGQLQVELAQLNYLLPRLAGRGVMMSRLGGGIGTRGPGETQLETDRRRIFRRVRKIEEHLEAVRSHRWVERRQRRAVPLQTIGLVGYTNAGKSTLFNALTGAGVLADARMFATLDPTVRQLTLPSRRRALLADTVGFIRNLPTTLVKAFRATLEEVAEASLLLHLVDCTSPWAAEQAAHVVEVLGEIGAAATPQVLVLTKTDLAGGDFDPASQAERLAAAAGMPGGAARAVAVSARTGQGLGALRETIDALLTVDPVAVARFRFPAGAGSQRHWVHEFGRVLSERWEPDGCRVVAEVSQSLRSRLEPYLEAGAEGPRADS